MVPGLGYVTAMRGGGTARLTVDPGIMPDAGTAGL
jgi:hypothetical protein